jgi:O-antigen/teichoic acid export membrane protein
MRLSLARRLRHRARLCNPPLLAPKRGTMIRRALTNTGWLMGARGVNAVLSLGYLALATRALGLEGFGKFVLAVSFAQAITGLASFQTWQAVVRWGHGRKDPADAVGFALALDLLTVVAGAIGAALLLFLAGSWLPVPPALRTEAFWLTLVMLLAVRSTPTGILRLHDRYALAATADAVTPVVRLVGAAAVFLFAQTSAAFVIVWGVAELATAFAYWRFALRHGPLPWRKVSLTRLPREEKGAWRFVWGTGLSGALLIASRQLIVLLVGALGGAALAGIYRVAAQLGEGLLKLAQALLRATYPELVRDPEGAREIAARIARIAVITGVVTIGFGALAGDWVILAIAGREYLAAYVPMLVLAGAAAIELAGAPLEALLVARGRALTNFVLRALPTALALAALPFAVARGGAGGAAAAVLIASALSVAGLMIASRER